MTYNDIDEQPRTSPEALKSGRVGGSQPRQGRFAMVPTGSGEIAFGTFRAILRQLGLRPEDLR